MALSDFRSDANCSPTEEMWEAMRSADTGWATKGEDRNVSELESLGAEMLGKEAGLLVATCSMANLLALMSLSEPGTGIVAGERSHIATSEALSIDDPLGLVARWIDDSQGIPEPEAVEQALSGHRAGQMPPISVISLENSHNNSGGAAVTGGRTQEVAAIARRAGVAVHLDGARLLNSAVSLGVPPRVLTEAVDTVAVSLSKGLGAPLGALVCGSTSVIAKARVNAVRIGAASLHKAGIFAAAGIVALTTMVDRLAEDHRRAELLAQVLGALPGTRVVSPSNQINIVLVDTSASAQSSDEIVDGLRRHGLLALARSATSVRFVTYRDIGDEDIELAVSAFAVVLEQVQLSQ